jgi:spore coat polysaccharide biosynthesis protein SpsF
LNGQLLLTHAKPVRSVLEFGANIGLNLQALRMLLPEAELSAVEINEKAIAELRKCPWLTAHHCSIAEFQSDQTYDFVLSKGVLIHANPGQLNSLYDVMHKATGTYLCIVEYFNPTPVSVTYRGNEERLFKRDFAGELLARFPDLHLVHNGFASRRSANFPQDDLNWFLLEKSY